MKITSLETQMHICTSGIVPVMHHGALEKHRIPKKVPSCWGIVESMIPRNGCKIHRTEM